MYKIDTDKKYVNVQDVHIALNTLQFKQRSNKYINNLEMWYKERNTQKTEQIFFKIDGTKKNVKTLAMERIYYIF